MPRLGQVGRDDAHGFARAVYRSLFGDRDPVAKPGTATGTPGNWWTVFALVPDVPDHTTAGFQFYRSPDRLLSPKLRELGQLRRLGGGQSLRVLSALQGGSRRRLDR